MGKIDQNLIKYLGALAKIRIDAKQAGSLTQEIKNILAMIERLQAAPVGDLKPTSQVTGLTDVWRKDEVKPSSLSREELLKNAPLDENGYIKVRRVL